MAWEDYFDIDIIYNELDDMEETLHHLKREKKRREKYPFSMPEDYFWTTKDGTEIAYEDLTDSHLNNIINLVERKINGLRSMLE